MTDNIFIQLYVDEDVDVLIATLLQARGFTAITTRDAGQLGKTDAEQLAYAISQNKTLLTHNRIDFENSQSHQGIIIATRQTAQEIVRRLLIILNNITADEMKDQLVYI